MEVDLTKVEVPEVKPEVKSEVKPTKKLIKEFEEMQKTKNEELHKMDLPGIQTLRGVSFDK